jgi:hypothetical protein
MPHETTFAPPNEAQMPLIEGIAERFLKYWIYVLAKARLLPLSGNYV